MAAVLADAHGLEVDDPVCGHRDLGLAAVGALDGDIDDMQGMEGMRFLIRLSHSLFFWPLEGCLSDRHREVRTKRFHW